MEKIRAHTEREPRPVGELRDDLPSGLGVTRIPLLCGFPVERVLFSLNSVFVKFFPVAVEID